MGARPPQGGFSVFWGTRHPTSPIGHRRAGGRGPRSMLDPMECPLFFSTRELISGNGFVASVSGLGRCLMVKEGGDEGWWLYGVEPGGLADCGVTAQEAALRFLAGFRNYLTDLAAEARDFKAFREAAITFFGDVDKEDAHRWSAGVEAPAAVPAPDPWLASLATQAASTACGVQVEQVGEQFRPTAQLNSSETWLLPTAA